MGLREDAERQLSQALTHVKQNDPESARVATEEALNTLDRLLVAQDLEETPQA